MSRCSRAKELFGSYWDDETTRAEREWIESHFAACPRCREDYDAMARALSAVATLPRVEAAPDLAERALAAARREAPAPDRIFVPQRAQWATPALAAAGLLLAVGAIAPWLLGPQGAGMLAHRITPVAQPRLVASAVPVAREAKPRPVAAAVADSLFDHSEDVDFVLDPMTLHRGRARSTAHASPTVQGEQAVITF